LHLNFADIYAPDQHSRCKNKFITKNVIFCIQFCKTDKIVGTAAQLQEANCEQNKAL